MNAACPCIEHETSNTVVGHTFACSKCLSELGLYDILFAQTAASVYM